MEHKLAATICTFTAYREVMASLIQQHRGRVVDAPGENLLVERASVIEVVRCAVVIQQECKVRNAELPPHHHKTCQKGTIFVLRSVSEKKYYKLPRR